MLVLLFASTSFSYIPLDVVQRLVAFGESLGGVQKLESLLKSSAATPRLLLPPPVRCPQRRA